MTDTKRLDWLANYAWLHGTDWESGIGVGLVFEPMTDREDSGWTIGRVAQKDVKGGSDSYKVSPRDAIDKAMKGGKDAETLQQDC